VGTGLYRGAVIERSEFVGALIAAPVGAALLAMLENAARRDVPPWEVPLDSNRDAVAAATDAMAETSLGPLLAVAVDTAAYRVGPWMPDAPANLAAAFRHAEDRRALAEAIADRFGPALHAPVDPLAQQWWHSGSPEQPSFTRPRFRAFDEVYGAGQFTWAGLWTVSDPPPEVHTELIGAWELDHAGPVSRWRLPARPDARVVEIHRPEDWVRLVTTHPATGRTHPEWELPGPNQRGDELDALLAIDGQHGARTSIRRHLVPDWGEVAAHVDGVHLSWAGFLTAEGYVSDLGDGDVALLRYWFSERTHWVNDVFAEPVPLAAPHVGPELAVDVIDVRHDRARRADDRAVLDAQRRCPPTR